jgi:hypothetical protein
VQCPEDEDRYISEFHKREGIQLVKEYIGLNSAKRGLAKLCLNFMCGKLTERIGHAKKMITDQQELYKFLATPDIEVAALVVFIMAVYRRRKCLTFGILMKL